MGLRKFHLYDFSSQLNEMSTSCMGWSKNGSQCTFYLQGWYAQQVLKLKIAKFVPTEYYILLDSKNAFVKDIDEDAFFSPCNQGKIYGTYRFEDIPQPHKEWYAAPAN